MIVKGKKMIIALEGINGSGKTTIADAIAEIRLVESYSYPEKMGTVGAFNKVLLGEKARMFSMATSLLNLYSMATSDSLMFPGDDVDIIQSRCQWSSIVYGMFDTNAVDLFGDKKLFDLLYELAGEISPPSLIIYLDVDPAIAYQRLQKREQSHPYYCLEHLAAAYENYSKILQRNPGGSWDYNWARIDASQPIEVVIEEALEAVDTHFRPSEF